MKRRKIKVDESYFMPNTPQNTKEYAWYLIVYHRYDRKDLINAGIPAKYLK